MGPNLLPAAHLAHLPKGSWRLVGHQADELQGKMQEQHQEDIAKPSCFPMVRRPQEKVIFVLVTELPVSHNARLSRLSSWRWERAACARVTRAGLSSFCRYSPLHTADQPPKGLETACKSALGFPMLAVSGFLRALAGHGNTVCFSMDKFCLWNAVFAFLSRLFSFYFSLNLSRADTGFLELNVYHNPLPP